ncbi:ABC transporter ATP-binding protein [Wolinella succinogenes]|uniref:ABC TRANSPORTER, ATP-BINDING PROTEIN n=1 Tax=Wolinella succinogenes (strain ATCC 29543 / DSM 1740 / CCUG 13145 / JCM 31913 / LMG 7466 / NCTC 11488 / FDC 602W) TaxID=273121 RepID=Q7M987_WOLSU|nr:ABC transporter ATP-binding protein [Wolinella succinogenes]CAE10204.1 ABC TRANSPORTER, ATP-BINDING PROTEIN [Wolinella succinogenes]VEG82419.1 Aliphatic sulfonates import ATP-binding protein SsuB [Wolinella succinogenes]HCZ18261.1 ABC transporter ATP-binding protein [Helicobacter sp.]
MSLITLKNLWKSYGDHVILENLSLEIKEGEFCTLVGPSGCGKSTFLRMLLGQESPTRGLFLFEGAPFPQEPSPERGIVFQRYSVFPHLNVLENVMLGIELKESPFLGRLFGAKRREAKARALEMLEAVGLSDSAQKYPSELSGGMQQRLSIAQSLIKHPKLLLLDEPFGALDPGIRADMHELILKLWKKNSLTIVMVTHDLHEGFYLGTRLLVFGKVRQDPHAPHAFGSCITYDIPVNRDKKEKK